jgi:translocation and assembly module TamB
MGRTAKQGLAGVALFAIALAGLWSARRPIADDAIARELARRGVSATYGVRDIGFRTQRLENVVVGDARRPDLTARAIEVDLVPTWSGVAVRAVRAEGVIVRGRYDGARLSWGAVDRLLPPPTGRPFALPAVDAVLRDVRVLIATPYGPLGARIDGAGRLDSGFGGTTVIGAGRLAVAGCAVTDVMARFAVRTDRRDGGLGGAFLPRCACRCAARLRGRGAHACWPCGHAARHSARRRHRGSPN